jgi:predicted dehydrogenase
VSGHLNVGIAGLGYWGTNLARTFAAQPRARLTDLCDLDPARVAKLAAAHPEAHRHADFAAFLARPDLDAVAIATPPSRHHAMALAALRAGKHVWVEKPLALTAADGRELVEAARAAGRCLFVDETFLYDPLVREMKRLIDSGALGDVCHLSFERLGMGRIRRDSNVWWNSAPHDLSILFYLIDSNPVAALATGQAFLRKGFEDVAFLHVDFESGAMGAAHVSWLDPHKVRRVTVVGDRRMIVFDDVEPVEKVKVFDRGASYEAASDEGRGADFGYFKALIRDGDIHAPKVPGTEPLRVQLAHFADCCLNGTAPETDGASARRVVSLLETATASLRAGGMPMPLEPAPFGR